MKTHNDRHRSLSIIILATAGLCTGALLFVGQNANATTYTITDLGALGGTYTQSAASGVNDNGQVVGESDQGALGGSPDPHAFLYTGGTMQDLGQGVARAISGNGQVVGDYGGGYSAFLYDAGSMTDLGQGFALGVNNSGEVVGEDEQSPTPHAFLFAGSTRQDLGPGAARGINNAGEVVGGNGHAFLYSNGTMHDLGTLGGVTSQAFAINENDQVVGSSLLPGNSAEHAFLYSGGAMLDLGTIGGDSIAYSINAYGLVVGNYAASGSFVNHSDPSPLVQRPFLYANGTMSDLSDLIPASSEWTLESATGINNLGQIVGSGINPDGALHAFLLTPVSSAPAEAPTALLLSCVLPLFLRKRKE